MRVAVHSGFLLVCGLLTIALCAQAFSQTSGATTPSSTATLSKTANIGAKILDPIPDEPHDVNEAALSGPSSSALSSNGDGPDHATLPDAPAAQDQTQSAPQPPVAGPQINQLPVLPPRLTSYRLNASDKFYIYVHEAFGPPAVILPAIGAGFGMIHPKSTYPKDWNDGAGAFGRRYGDSLARDTSRSTAEVMTDTLCTAGGNTPGQPFIGNIIPSACISKQAQALLKYVALPNLPGEFLNYQRLTAAQTNTTKFGLRYNRSIGSGAISPLMGMLQRYLGRNAPGQSFYLNYNYMHTGADQLSLFPNFDGKSQINQNSLQVGYSRGIGKLTNSLSANWNRTNTQISNEFTNTTNIAAAIGLNGLPSNPLLYGLPSVTMKQFSSLNEQQPSFQINQTIAVSESSVWTHGKHNVKFGADVRRVHLDMIGETNSSGNYIFTGAFTAEPGTITSGTGSSGSSLADLLLGLPQLTAIQAPYQKAYLRENTYDAYAQDDWRALPSLTLLYGLRYEYFSPYSEKDDRLATLDTGNDFASVAMVLPNGIGPFTGKYPRGLVYPEHGNFSPRAGFAWSVAKDTVLRGGYGINFTNGQYVTFAQDLAFEPPWADVQTNEFSASAPITLANGFMAPNSGGNYAINKGYRLPYIQTWSLNLQRTVPWNVVLNIGYSGSKGTRLDIVDAPGRTATKSLSGELYDYEDSVGFSNYDALTASARKRLTGGISLQGRYTYSHSIDDASSIGGHGGTAVVPAQNWQDLLAEKSNSSFDIRHQVVGTFIYELPFGPDKHLLTTGPAAHALSNISLSGSFDFATGEPLTPRYQATFADVARGSAGSLRPDRVPGTSLMQGGGSLGDWFNKGAFTAPADVYGTASRFSIPGPGTVSFTASLSKTIRFSETRTFELRAIASNVFNTVQYSTVDSTLGSASFGQVTNAAPMRQFTFLALYRY